MFVKHRQGSAASKGSWGYAEYPDDSDLDDIRVDIRSNHYSWAEHARRTEVVEIDLPPKKWFRDEIARLSRRMRNCQKTLQRYRKLSGLHGAI